MSDTGYSNYTVDGRDFHCGLSAHPEDGFDVWYLTDDRLNFGATCAGFMEGEPVYMDVDCEEYDGLRPGQKVIFDKWLKSID